MQLDTVVGIAEGSRCGDVVVDAAAGVSTADVTVATKPAAETLRSVLKTTVALLEGTVIVSAWWPDAMANMSSFRQSTPAEPLYTLRKS